MPALNDTQVTKVTMKSPGFTPTMVALASSVSFPMLVIAMFCIGLVVPRGCEANVRLAGANCAIGVVPIPVHVINTACGLAGPRSVKSNDAVRLSSARVGEQLAETVQLAPEARLDPQLFETKVNWSALVPPKPIELMARDVDATLVTVTF